MKTRLYWSYATRSLARGGQRTLLAVLCVAVGVLAIVAIQLVISAIDAGVSDNARRLNGADVVGAASGTAPLSTQQLTILDRLKARGTITTYSVVDAQTMRVRGSAANPSLLAVDPAHFPLAGGVVITTPSGSHLSTLLHGTTVVVTTRLAQQLAVGVGGRLHIFAQDGRAATVTVGGIAASAGVLQGPLMVIARDTYARLPSTLAQPFAYNDIYIDVPGHTDARAARVAALVRRTFALDSVATTKSTLDGYRSQIASGRYFVQIVGLLVLLIGGMGIMNTMQVALRRRRTEIAMLKAMGYRRRDLYALFGLEAGLIGLAGGLIGAALGSAVSAFIKGLVENLLGVVWPTVIDARILAAGIALGAGTALIFGLWPIVQASEWRPQVVLRGLAADVGRASRGLTAALAALLALLFVALAAGILGNLSLALEAIVGMGIAVAVLSLVFALVVAAIGVLPVPDSVRARNLAPVGLVLLLAPGVTVAQPAVGVLLLVAAVLGLLVVLLPRTWRWTVKLALRRIGRQRARTVGTLLTLCIGVFAIGLVLTLDQDVQTLFTQRVFGHDVRVGIIVSQGDRAAVQRELDRTPGLTHEEVDTISPAHPLALNGRPFGALVHAALTAKSGHTYTTSDLIQSFSGVEGHDLAGHHPPDPAVYTIVRGAHDRGIGRNLTAVDVGTRNALLLVYLSGPPFNLRLGDTMTVAGPEGPAHVTLHIVGFFGSPVSREPIQADKSVVSLLVRGAPADAFYATLLPKTATASLDRIQGAVPNAQIYGPGDVLSSVVDVLNKLTLVLLVIASLALLAGIVLIANTVALTLLERRRELGILKAVGYTSRDVLGAVLVENGAIGVVGGMLAMLLVAAVAPLIGHAVYNQPFSVPVPLMLAAIPLTAAICMAVAAAVAWRATSVRPLEVLRYE